MRALAQDAQQRQVAHRRRAAFVQSVRAVRGLRALRHARVAPEPAAAAWLTSAGFAYTHRIVDITEPDRDQEFVLYAKKVGAGTLALGGNSQPPASSGSNYIVAVAPDGDSDGIPDVTDNCPNTANTAQPDTDLDGSVISATRSSTPSATA
jgi:hypothetical protein